METILFFVSYQPALLAITLMLFYTMWKIDTGKLIVHLISMAIIAIALVLQYRSAIHQMMYTNHLKLKLNHIEKVLKENHITIADSMQYKKTDEMFNKFTNLNIK